MKLLLLILATALTLAGAASSRSYHQASRHNREPDRRKNLDYEDIETADQEEISEFQGRSIERSDTSRKSARVGVYPPLAKSKNQRRHPKLKDSEASGTHYDGTHYAAHYAAPQVQQIHTHELLTNQGLVPVYHQPGLGHGAGGNILLAGGLGVTGIAEPGHHHGPLLVQGLGAAPGLIAANPAAVAPQSDLSTDITKSVYVFSAPPDPFDVAPRQTLTKVPQRQQKHYQVLFINSPTAPQPQHHVELPPPPELKTLVYVLVKKPQPPLPINFIKPQLPPQASLKPEVYFIRYKGGKGGGHEGLAPAAVAPIDGGHPHPLVHGVHPGVQYAPVYQQEELRGNIDYGPALQPQYEAAAQHHPYAINGYQEEPQLSASHVLAQRGPTNREIDAGVSGI